MSYLRVLLVVVLFISCNEKKAEPRDEATGPSVLVMVDFSASAKELLPLHRAHLGDVIGRIPPRGRCVVGKIAQTTEATFDPFVDKTIPADPGVMDVEQDVLDTQNSARSSLGKAVESAFANPSFSPGTNIVSALRLVKQVFPDSGRRVLVLLSDMQHASNDFSLEKDKITEAYIDKTLARLQQDGKMPDLKGVDIYVAGATAKTDDRYNQIRKFWEKLFAQAGGRLKSYSHTLLNFEL